jgi:hypothetical protein
MCRFEAAKVAKKFKVLGLMFKVFVLERFFFDKFGFPR